MKTLVIQSNHGNHSGFNRKWELLGSHDSVKEARKQLINVSIEVTDGSDGWTVKNDRAWNSYSKDFLATNKSNSFEYDLVYYHLLREDEVYHFFNGGSKGYMPDFVKEEFNIEDNE